MTLCPVCGEMYLVHFEGLYSCTNGHNWYQDPGGSSVPAVIPEPPNNPGPERAEMEMCST